MLRIGCACAPDSRRAHKRDKPVAVRPNYALMQPKRERISCMASPLSFLVGLTALLRSPSLTSAKR